FNEVDECAGLDGLVTNRVWKALKQSPENTLHDLRWGAPYKGKNINDYVWVFLISGAAPPAHFINGYKGTSSERQPPMYFPLGGGTCKGISKPGEIVWSRIYVQNNELHMDIGRGGVVSLPEKETQRRWEATTPQWPIMHAVTYGVSRDQMMARHKANHIQVAYASSKSNANRALAAKAAMMQALGVQVHVCGTDNGLVA
ncbi:MAG: fucose isomerase, partial [bacterium]|nr:fucose isomerase [bacterium]